MKNGLFAKSKKKNVHRRYIIINGSLIVKIAQKEKEISGINIGLTSVLYGVSTVKIIIRPV